MIVSSNSWGPGYGGGEYGLSGWTGLETMDKQRFVMSGGGGTGIGVLGSTTILTGNLQYEVIETENLVFGGTVEWRNVSKRTELGWVKVSGEWRYYGEWVDDGVLCSWSDWIEPPCWGEGKHNMEENGEYQYRSQRYGAWGLGSHSWSCEWRQRNWQNIPNLPKVHGPWSNWNPVIGSDAIYILGVVPPPTQGPTRVTAANADADGIATEWDTQLIKRGENIIIQRRPVKLFFGSNGTYKKRTKTWVPSNNGSGEVNAVSSVNTSFASFSVNTSGISLGGDGSHSHTISIPTSGSSNENGHTHTVEANGTADINVSGSTISGGAHSHTFDFIYSELKDISDRNTRIASETTVKNRKMRIWRRTA
jgi:hypothetical protein